MNTYFIKVALRDVSPMIWRRLRVQGNTSLAELHHIIQIAMGWDNEHLHSFRIYGEDYGVLEFFPRKRTKTSRTHAPSTFPEGGTFPERVYNPLFCSLIR
jgi:hypothetical protein